MASVRLAWGTIASVFLVMLAACTSALPVTTARGGLCVTSPQTPPANVRVSHDAFLAHSEPMLAEDPANPLLLVGGSKFFTKPATYQFQIGWYFSIDGGCTWTDGGTAPRLF